jgi:hypothetical protein
MAKDRGSRSSLVLVETGTVEVVPLLLVRFGKLDLDAINTVYTVDEENKDEDKSNLHPIL